MKTFSAIPLVAIFFASSTQADDPPTKEPACVAQREYKIDDKDSPEAKLLKERFNAAQQDLRERYNYWPQGIGALPEVFEAARRMIEARNEAGRIPHAVLLTWLPTPGTPPLAREEGMAAPTLELEILQEKVDFARFVEKQAEQLARTQNRAQFIADLHTARYFRADSELQLLRQNRPASR